MATVAVTAAASPVGRLLLTRLMADGHRVCAIDAQRPPVAVPFRAAGPDGSVRPAALRDVQVVVHTLPAFQPRHDQVSEALAEVESTRSLLAAAGAAPPQALILISSATTYGAHEDNPVPLFESAPLRAGPEFSYAWHRRLAEELVQAFAARHPGVRVVTLRPVTLLGQGHDDFVARFLESPRLPLVRGHRPPMQVLHPADLADAVALAVSGELRGAYNVAPDGWLTADEVCEVLGRKPVGLPEPVAFALAGRLWVSRLASAPAGGLHYLMHPWVVDTRRLREAGWVPRHTNREVLEAFAAVHRGHVTVGPLHTSRRTLAAAGLLAGAVVGFAGRAALRRSS